VNDAELIALALSARLPNPAKIEPRPAPRPEDRLRQAQKMDALGQITGGMAHDFNNLLLAINFNLEALAEQVPASPTTEPLFERARQAIDEAQGLIGHLLAFSRRQPLSATSVDINQSVLATSNMLRRAIPSGVEVEARLEIEARLGRTVGLVLTDRNQLETALLNLALNARDAMPNGGRLTIGTADITLDAAYTALHPGTACGRYVLVAVSDSGPGMAPEIAERAFEPFFTTKSGAAHSGLGLSQVYGYAKQSGGHARIDSEPGRGTTVQLFLPRFADIAPAARGVAAQGGARGEIILLVEDAALVRNAVAKMLADLGYVPIAAADADEAVAVIESGRRIDLLLTDMMLPGSRDGGELATEARRLRPRLAVLCMSGETEPALPTALATAGRFAFIAKPFSKPQLAEQLRALLDGEAVAG
jgi:signal transduction histidine kinase/CheY-like chemotaxis protein